MSQQEMQFEDLNQDNSQASYSGYEGSPQRNTYSTNYYGQKLSSQGFGRGASAGQRLALAIVSLALLMVMIIVMVSVALGTHASILVAVPLIIICGIFAAVVTIINVVFNRNS